MPGRGGEGGVKRTWVAAAEDTDPEIPEVVGVWDAEAVSCPCETIQSQKGSLKGKSAKEKE